MEHNEIGATIRARREALGWSQTDLARRTGIKQSSIYAIERGETKKSKFLPEIARELGLRPDEVGLPAEQQIAPGVLSGAALIEPERDFPIYASVEGGPGEIIRSADAVDWYPRPAPVAHVKNAYGLLVIGESMAPEFEPGDVALINPALPPLAGKPCIFYAEHNGEARATIKRYLRSTADKWFVYQHNPPPGAKHEFTLGRREWSICHRVLGKYYPQ